MLLTIKTVTRQLIVLTILLIIVSCTTWENRPYVGDYENQSIIHSGNLGSDSVYCGSPDFEAFICWHHLEIADLLSILETYKIKTKESKKVKALIAKLKKKLKDFHASN